MSPALASAVVATFGLVCGSFLNAVIHRLPRGIGLSHPRRSFCPHCGHSIAWHENVPLLSWLWLRGRCSACPAKISLRYPLVEAMTAALFLWLWWGFPPFMNLAYMVLAALLVAGTFIDLEHMILPDSLTLGGALLGVLCSVLVPGLQGCADWEESLRSSLFGAGVGFAALFAVVELGKIAFGRKRFALDPHEDFTLTAGEGKAQLKLGGEVWELDDFFYRPTDALELHLADGATWRLARAGVERDGKTTSYAEAEGWSGIAKSVVVPREAMGFGDVKLMLTLGAFLGWPGALFSIGAGSVIGAVCGIMLMALRRLGEAGRLPFGPYLAAGAMLWIAAGPAILSWYLHR